MSNLLFGTAGIPLSVDKRTTPEGIKRLKELGLGCMEIEFVRSVQMGEKTALEVRSVAEEYGIELTVHAPYYVNLNSPEKEKVEASKTRVFKAAKIGHLAGAKSVTFHAAFYHSDDHSDVFSRVVKHLKDLRNRLDDEGIDLFLRPETTGSPTQFGTLVEIVELSKEIPRVVPCIDFSHIHARYNGEKNSYEDFCECLQLVKTELGQDALNNLHMHISGIDYGDKGEKKHLVLKESDMNYEGVMRALFDFNVGGWLICESPSLEEDALLLKNTYNEIRESMARKPTR